MSNNMNEKTLNILAHIQKYGFITACQCANIFYKDNKQALTMAQRKLKSLFQSKLIDRYKDRISGSFIYTHKKSTISQHDITIMDLYSYIFNKYQVEYFKKECSWPDTKRRSDAHIIFERDDVLVAYLVEVDLYHSTSQRKLDEMFNKGEIHQWYRDNYSEEFYPDVLIINATASTKNKSDEYNIKCLNYNLDDIDNVL